MKRASVILTLLLAGCGNPFPAQQCNVAGYAIRTEDGVSESCNDFGQQLDTLHSLFVQRWGAVDLRGWFVVVSPLSNPVPDHAGYTNWNQRRLTLSEGALQLFPHELLHAQLGPASAQHAEPVWCSEFALWEIAESLDDEREYLGCP